MAFAVPLTRRKRRISRVLIITSWPQKFILVIFVGWGGRHIEGLHRRRHHVLTNTSFLTVPNGGFRFRCHPRLSRSSFLRRDLTILLWDDWLRGALSGICAGAFVFVSEKKSHCYMLRKRHMAQQTGRRMYRKLGNERLRSLRLALC